MTEMDNPQKEMKKRIWRLIYPSLTYTGIMYAVAVVTMSVIITGMLDQIDPGLLFGDSEALIIRMQEVYYANIVLIQGIAALVTLPVLLLYLRWNDARRAEADIVKKPADHSPAWMVLILVFGAVASYAGNGMIALSGLNQVDDGYDQIANLIYQGNLGLEIVSLGILAPIVEELIFRGLMYTQLSEYMKKSRAVVLAAVLFGAYHGNLLQGIYAAALGLLMIYVYERFHTLIAPILFHIGANVFGVLMTETEIFAFLYQTSGALYTSVIVSSLLIIVVVWLVERRTQKVAETEINEE